MMWNLMLASLCAQSISIVDIISIVLLRQLMTLNAMLALLFTVA